MSQANQQAGIYIHGDKALYSPVHGGKVPTHGGISPLHGSPNLDGSSVTQWQQVGHGVIDGGGSASSINFGNFTVPNDGEIIIVSTCLNRQVTTVNFGGVGRTLYVEASAGGLPHLSIWHGPVTAGLKNLTVVAAVGFMGVTAAQVFLYQTSNSALDEAARTRAWAFTPDPNALGATVNVPAGGLGLVAAAGGSHTSAPTWSAGITQEYLDQNASVELITGSFTGSKTPTLSGFNNAGVTMVGISLKP